MPSGVLPLHSAFAPSLQVLRLDGQPALTKPVDPSLFLHRFIDKLGFAKEKIPVGADSG